MAVASALLASVLIVWMESSNLNIMPNFIPVSPMIELARPHAPSIVRSLQYGWRVISAGGALTQVRLLVSRRCISRDPADLISRDGRVQPGAVVVGSVGYLNRGINR